MFLVVRFSLILTNSNTLWKWRLSYNILLFWR